MYHIIVDSYCTWSPRSERSSPLMSELDAQEALRAFYGQELAQDLFLAIEAQFESPELPSSAAASDSADASSPHALVTVKYRDKALLANIGIKNPDNYEVTIERPCKIITGQHVKFVVNIQKIGDEGGENKPSMRLTISARKDPSTHNVQVHQTTMEYHGDDQELIDACEKVKNTVSAPLSDKESSYLLLQGYVYNETNGEFKFWIYNAEEGGSKQVTYTVPPFDRKTFGQVVKKDTHNNIFLHNATRIHKWFPNFLSFLNPEYIAPKKAGQTEQELPAPPPWPAENIELLQKIFEIFYCCSDTMRQTLVDYAKQYAAAEESAKAQILRDLLEITNTLHETLANLRKIRLEFNFVFFDSWTLNDQSDASSVTPPSLKAISDILLAINMHIYEIITEPTLEEDTLIHEFLSNLTNVLHPFISVRFEYRMQFFQNIQKIILAIANKDALSRLMRTEKSSCFRHDEGQSVKQMMNRISVLHQLFSTCQTHLGDPLGSIFLEHHICQKYKPSYLEDMATEWRNERGQWELPADFLRYVSTLGNNLETNGLKISGSFKTFMNKLRNILSQSNDRTFIYCMYISCHYTIGALNEFVPNFQSPDIADVKKFEKTIEKTYAQISKLKKLIGEPAAKAIVNHKMMVHGVSGNLSICWDFSQEISAIKTSKVLQKVLTQAADETLQQLVKIFESQDDHSLYAAIGYAEKLYNARTQKKALEERPLENASDDGAGPSSSSGILRQLPGEVLNPKEAREYNAIQAAARSLLDHAKTIPEIPTSVAGPANAAATAPVPLK